MVIRGQGGCRKTAADPSAAATRPVITPRRATRPLSTAGVQVVVPSVTVYAPIATGRPRKPLRDTGIIVVCSSIVIGSPKYVPRPAAGSLIDIGFPRVR